MDSLIRLNQLNLSELSGYIASVFNSFPQQNISGNLVPSESGVYSLGSSLDYYKNVYVNGISIPSGSGITIGNSFITAYTSGGAGIIKIDDYLISSSGDFVFIQGPQGIQGPTGLTGPIGPTGIGITGASYNQESYTLTLSFSDGFNTGVKIPPLSGETGISITGFFQSGDLIYPQFDKFRGIGNPIKLIAGPQGFQGLPGTATLYFDSGFNMGRMSKIEFPNSVNILDYYDSNSFPSISLMRGMSYTFDVSGLGTHIITEQDYYFITGLLKDPTIPFTKVGENSNYYSDSLNGTGYWRVSFFDYRIGTGIYSGVYEDEQSFYNAISGKNEEVYGQSSYFDAYRNSITFNTKYIAQNLYKYGFVVYSLGENGDEVLNSGTIPGANSIAIVVGDVFVSSGVGPPGLQGIQGLQGPEGPPGTGVGPKGDPGPGILAVNQKNYEIQFVFQDGSVSNWFEVPQGGPPGPTGSPGSFINHFSGEYSSSTIYKLNDTISRNGSTYIYINSTTGSNKNPEDYLGTYWQLLAKSGLKGDKGETGASGIADRYSSNFFVKASFPTGLNNFLNNSTGINVNSIPLSGIEAIFKVGDIVSFRNSGIIGYSYTPNQNLIFSSNSVLNSYFFGKVRSYNSSSGIIDFIVESGGTGILNNTISGNYFLWYNYNNANLNLGANLMSGSPGPEGPIGPQGPAGTPSLLRNTGIIYLKSGESILLNPSGLDVFNITITGNGQVYYGTDNIGIDFNWNYFETGKCVLLKIRNSGVPFGNNDRPLFYFSGESYDNIKWPNDIYTRPDDKETYIYSILRFIDEDGHPACFGTYSNPYKYE